MTKTMDSIIADVIRAEGGYSNDPRDPGGETNFGITIAVARANGYKGPMKDLPRSLVEQIYRSRYIEVPRFDRIYDLDRDIGAELIDTGVNMGPATAAMFLQRWLNGFNYERTHDDLFVDGRVGQLTIDALARFFTKRGQEGRRVMLQALNCTQGTRYLEIVEGKASSRAFLYGWMNNRVVN